MPICAFRLGCFCGFWLPCMALTAAYAGRCSCCLPFVGLAPPGLQLIFKASACTLASMPQEAADTREVIQEGAKDIITILLDLLLKQVMAVVCLGCLAALKPGSIALSFPSRQKRLFGVTTQQLCASLPLSSPVGSRRTVNLLCPGCK